MKKVDIFGSFLRDPLPTAPNQVPSEPSAPEVEKRLLGAFGALDEPIDEPIDVKRLIALSGGSPTTVLKILGDMESVGLLKRGDADGAPAFAITELGKAVR